MNRNLTRKTNGPRAEAINLLAEEYNRAKADKKDAAINYDSAKGLLIEMLNGAMVVETDKFVVTNTNHPKHNVDVKRLEQERPDIYKEYLRPVDCWTLTATEKKEVKVL